MFSQKISNYCLLFELCYVCLMYLSLISQILSQINLIKANLQYWTIDTDYYPGELPSPQYYRVFSLLPGRLFWVPSPSFDPPSPSPAWLVERGNSFSLIGWRLQSGFPSCWWVIFLRTHLLVTADADWSVILLIEA